MALSTIETLRQKIRALANDVIALDTEVFTYTNFDIFPLSEPNITEIEQVTKNGELMDVDEYSYDSSLNQLTISPDTGNELANGDVLIVKYLFYKYSTTELDEYVRASLVWLSIFDVSARDYELEDDEIIPIPDNRTTDLIALVASVLVNPNWSEYRLPNLTVKYPRTLSKDEKIERLINRFTLGSGLFGTLDLS